MPGTRPPYPREFRQQMVELFRAVELKQTEDRFRPTDSVPAFRIAIDSFVAVRDELAVFRFEL